MDQDKTHRQLAAFKNLTNVKDFEAEKRKRDQALVSCSRLVQDPVYLLLKQMAEEHIRPYAMSAPINSEQQIHYQTFCIMRDTLNSYFDRIERAAAEAPQIQEHED